MTAKAPTRTRGPARAFGSSFEFRNYSMIRLGTERSSRKKQGRAGRTPGQTRVQRSHRLACPPRSVRPRLLETLVTTSSHSSRCLSTVSSLRHGYASSPSARPFPGTRTPPLRNKTLPTKIPGLGDVRTLFCFANSPAFPGKSLPSLVGSPTLSSPTASVRRTQKGSRKENVHDRCRRPRYSTPRREFALAGFRAASSSSRQAVYDPDERRYGHASRAVYRGRQRYCVTYAPHIRTSSSDDALHPRTATPRSLEVRSHRELTSSLPLSSPTPVRRLAYPQRGDGPRLAHPCATARRSALPHRAHTLP